MGVYNKLTKNKHSNEKKPKSSEEKSNENSSKSSNFEPSKEDKSSSEKNEVKKLKDENTNLKKGTYLNKWVQCQKLKLVDRNQTRIKMFFFWYILDYRSFNTKWLGGKINKTF